jgi:hypothetical protein
MIRRPDEGRDWSVFVRLAGAVADIPRVVALRAPSHGEGVRAKEQKVFWVYIALMSLSVKSGERKRGKMFKR